MNKSTIDKVVELAERVGWSVDVEENKTDVVLNFNKYSPKGQDFNFQAYLENNNIGTMLESISECINDFDVSSETQLWLGYDGHGINGAPYDMKDVYVDMEACLEMMRELYTELGENIR